MKLCNYNHNIINLMVNRRLDIKIEEISITYIFDQQHNYFVLASNFSAGSENNGIYFALTPSKKLYEPYTSYVAEGYPEKNIIRYGLYFRFENMRLEFGEGRK